MVMGFAACSLTARQEAAEDKNQREVVTTDVTTDTTTDDSTTSDDGAFADAFTKTALLEGIAQNVVFPGYEFALIKTKVLQSSVQAYVTALEAGDAATELEAAQEAWKAAALAWQETELYQFGPAADLGGVATAMGAKGLRKQIYSWPLTNPCRVDQESLENVFSAANYTMNELENVYGLDAIEYLLFNRETTNACSSGHVVNNTEKEVHWAQLSDSDIRERRAHHALALTKEVNRQVESLIFAWKPGGENYMGSFTTAGNGSSLFGSVQLALNDVTDALFYLDTLVKDKKLAKPAGIQDCTAASCEGYVESLYARYSKEMLHANLVGFQKIFLGGKADVDAIGFDDYLVSVGAKDLAERMTKNIQIAVDELSMMEGSLYGAAQSFSGNTCDTDEPELCAVYRKVKAVTDDLKTQFVNILDLELPQFAEGDND